VLKILGRVETWMTREPKLTVWRGTDSNKVYLATSNDESKEWQEKARISHCQSQQTKISIATIRDGRVSYNFSQNFLAARSRNFRRKIAVKRVGVYFHFMQPATHNGRRLCELMLTVHCTTNLARQ